MEGEGHGVDLGGEVPRHLPPWQPTPTAAPVVLEVALEGQALGLTRLEVAPGQLSGWGVVGVLRSPERKVPGCGQGGWRPVCMKVRWWEDVVSWDR